MASYTVSATRSRRRLYGRSCVTRVASREGDLHAVRLSAAYAASIVTIVACAIVLMVLLLGILRGVALDPPIGVSRPERTVRALPDPLRMFDPFDLDLAEIKADRVALGDDATRYTRAARGHF